MSEWPSRRRDRYLHNTQQTQETNQDSAGFKPAIPEIEPPQTYTVDHAATGIGSLYTACNNSQSLLLSGAEWCSLPNYLPSYILPNVGVTSVCSYAVSTLESHLSQTILYVIFGIRTWYQPTCQCCRGCNVAGRFIDLLPSLFTLSEVRSEKSLWNLSQPVFVAFKFAFQNTYHI